MFIVLQRKVDAWVLRSVFSAGDDQEILLRKKIWWGLTLCWIFFSAYDLFIAVSRQAYEIAFINASGLSLCMLMLISFYFRRRRIDAYGLILQLLIVFMASSKIYLSNGIFNATGIVFAGMIGPIYALTFPNNRRAILIFFIYLFTILGSTIYKQWLIDPEIIADTAFRYSLYRFIGGISVIFFISMIYSAQIARLKQMEEERLIQLHHAKSKLYANITHEFRTPLTVIKGMAEHIRDDPEAKLNRGVTLIRSNADKLLKLVNQLLSMARLEADSMPVRYIQSDIIPFFRYLLESFHSVAAEKDIRLHFHSDHEELVMDYDPEIIEEVVSNLISNAIKFTPEGGDVYFQLEGWSGEKGKTITKLVLRIRDNGIGIEDEKQPYIFNRFYQADDDSTRKAEGTGIGLALVREYVQLIRGSVELKSRIDKGTEFIIRLPVSRSAPVEQFDYKIKKGLVGPTAMPSEGRIREDRIHTGTAGNEELPLLLIVEDNDDVVEYLKTVLSAGYRIEVASDGEWGISMALKMIPDMIICDVMMPKKDGNEVCETLKEDFRTNHIPIIMLTAKADVESKISSLENGADAYITKPFDKRELLVRIEKLIDMRQKLKGKFSDSLFTPSDNRKPQGLNEIFLHNLLENLGNNYHDENYGIDQLCSDTGISRTQLHRKLIALSGKSTSDFIRCFRINKAKILLADSDASVSEIAYQVGFRDPNYFTKSFVKETGITPSEFRSDHVQVKQ